jgi:hypothetical protein
MRQEIRILLTEGTFTQVCKMGTIKYFISEHEKYDFPMSSMDMKQLAGGKIVTKAIENKTFLITLQDIGSEMIRDILMRSPLYSGIAYDI